MLLSHSIVPVTDFRKHPFMKDGDDVMAVMKNNKPEYYCVSPLRLAQLLRAERELNDLAARMRGDDAK